MICRIAVLALFLLLVSSPRMLLAQYMYLDSNANGIHDAGDVMNPNGMPTIVDAWIDTNHNRDGSLASCETGDGDLSTWNSYAVHISTPTGTVSYGGFVNRFAQFSIPCVDLVNGFLSNATSMAVCQASFMPTTGGRQKMFTVTVTGETGTPSLRFESQNALDQNYTSFGTPCSGRDFDNTYKLGTSWFDADGLDASCVEHCPPVLAAIDDMTVHEGETATQALSATDSDGDPIQFQKYMGPPFMTVTTSNPQAGIGAVVLAPTYADAGTGILAAVRACDGVLIGQPRQFRIDVIHVNRAPVAVVGGPYAGTVGTPIAFDGIASADPDGDRLDYAWKFGDLGTGVGPTPAHTYAAAGTYDVELTVSDGSLTSTASTTATITEIVAARAFTTRANRLLRLGSGKPSWSIQIEPAAGTFTVDAVNFATVVMRSAGTGTVSEIHVTTAKPATPGDADGNGAPDFPATFARQDLEALFAGVNGSKSVPVTIEGTITSGALFRAETNIGVVGSGGAAAVAIVPNPLNPTGEIGFSTTRPGAVRVELFDVSGRLLRIVADEYAAEPGPLRYTLDGRGRSGQPLASGIYFVRVTTPDGMTIRRMAVVK